MVNSETDSVKLSLIDSEPRAAPETQVTVATRIPALDGLRGIAILLVLLNHGPFTIQNVSPLASRLFAVGRLSWSGVDLFFVLSGFLIGGILVDVKNSPRYFATFYLRRAYRIFPLYIAVVLAVYTLKILPIGFAASSSGEATIPLAAYATFTQNLWMAYWGAFGSAALGVTWSLAVEEQFYLTAPLLVRRLTRVRLVYVLVAIIVLSPLLRVLLLFGFHSHNLAAYVLMPCRADALCLGMLSAIVARDSRAMGYLVRKPALLYWTMVGLLASLAWLTYEGFTWYSTPMATFGYSLLALFYTCCLLIALLKTPLVEMVLCNRWLIELGGISYCVYLIHGVLIRAGRTLVGAAFQHLAVHLQHAQAFTMFLGALLGIGFALAVAKLSWRFLEQPMLRRGHTYKY